MEQITENYLNGKKMYREYCLKYGKNEALQICNRYLDLQINTKDNTELEFCKGLYNAIQTGI
jgi:hypothetical protein